MNINKSPKISTHGNRISTCINKSQSILKNNKGVALIIVAGVLIVLIVLAALAIDISYMYVVKNELQVAADAAALAGAAMLDGTNSITQTNARNEAVLFAGKNKAAGSPVVLASNGSNSLSTNNDITVGNWNGTEYRAGEPPINAVQVKARRTSDSPGGPVSLFFGRVIGWNVMTAAAEAIATRGGVPPGKGISICLKTCQLSPPPSDTNPIDLDVREQTANSPFGLAWTQFDQSSPIGTQSCTTNACRQPLDADCATNKGKRVAAIIWGLISPPNVCGQSITTQNGVANILDDLGCAFKSTSYDVENKIIEGGTVKKWNVIVPVQEKCPAGKEPGPWPVIKYAQIEISGVFDGQLKGIKITKIKCVDCGDIGELGVKGAALVK